MLDLSIVIAIYSEFSLEKNDDVPTFHSSLVNVKSSLYILAMVALLKVHEFSHRKKKKDLSIVPWDQHLDTHDLLRNLW